MNTRIFEAILNNDDKKLEESLYYRGFKMKSGIAKNIFTFVNEVKDYVADMDKDEAVEEAIFATADYFKDGKF